VTAEVVVLLVVLRKRLGGVEGRRISGSLGRVLLACLGMGAAIAVVLALGGQAHLSAPALVAAAGVTGAAVYLVLGRLLGVREIGRFFGALGRRR
jgi:peptidoglycan biosynthesis protein MviN/MurJ (putative lipid II flippase)